MTEVDVFSIQEHRADVPGPIETPTDPTACIAKKILHCNNLQRFGTVVLHFSKIRDGESFVRACTVR